MGGNRSGGIGKGGNLKELRGKFGPHVLGNGGPSVKRR